MADRRLRIAILHPLSSILRIFTLLLDDIDHHADKGGMIIGTAHPVKSHAASLSEVLRLDIEIIQDFHMIGDKADGRNDDRGMPFVSKSLDLSPDLGFKPRIAGPPAPTLVCKRTLRQAETVRDQSCGFFKLYLVWRLRSHCAGHAVRAENDRRGLSPVRWQPSQDCLDSFHPALDEQRMVVPARTIIELWHPIANFSTGIRDVFLITLPTRLGLVRRQNETQGLTYAVATHLFQRINKKRRRIAKCGVHGNLDVRRC